ncbi:MAG: hypothetical protein ACO1RX_20025 [Candidatus Sericytochromatia bacterium]
MDVQLLTDLTPLLTLLIGATLPIGFSFLTKRLDFNNDYFKKVIEKRLAACERIEVAIRPFLLISMDKDGKQCHNVIYEGFKDHFNPTAEPKDFLDCLIALNYAHRFSDYWVSQELSHHLGNLNAYLRDEVDFKLLYGMSSNRRWCVNYAQERFVPLKNHVDETYRFLQWEYTQVNRVHEFMKRRHGINPKNIWRLLLWRPNSKQSSSSPPSPALPDKSLNEGTGQSLQQPNTK